MIISASNPRATSGQMAANNHMVCTLPTTVRMLYNHMRIHPVRGIMMRIGVVEVLVIVESECRWPVSTVGESLLFVFIFFPLFGKQLILQQECLLDYQEQYSPKEFDVDIK